MDLTTYVHAKFPRRVAAYRELEQAHILVVLPANFLRQRWNRASAWISSVDLFLSPLLRRALFDKRARVRARFDTGMNSRRSGCTRRGDRPCKYYASGAIVRSACVLCSTSGLCKYTAYANRRRLNACSQPRVSSSARAAGFFLHFISRFCNYRSWSHCSTSVTDLPAARTFVCLSYCISPKAKRYKNIVRVASHIYFFKETKVSENKNIYKKS